MAKIDINLASSVEGPDRVWRAASAVLAFLAVVYTLYNLSAYRENRNKISSYGEGIARQRDGASAYGGKAAKGEASRLDEKEAGFYDMLATRRAFSWTGLLNDLEKSVPRNVFIVQISPDFKERKIRVTGMAKSMNDVLRMIDMMGAAFNDVFLLRHSEREAGAKGAGNGVMLFVIQAGYRHGGAR